MQRRWQESLALAHAVPGRQAGVVSGGGNATAGTPEPLLVAWQRARRTARHRAGRSGWWTACGGLRQPGSARRRDCGLARSTSLRALGRASIEWPPVPPAGAPGNIGADIGDVLRTLRACPGEHRSRDVNPGHLGPPLGQEAAHPELPARQVQHPFTSHGGQKTSLRHDQQRRVADPLRISLGELVIPNDRRRHHSTLAGQRRIAARRRSAQREGQARALLPQD